MTRPSRSTSPRNAAVSRTADAPAGVDTGLENASPIISPPRPLPPEPPLPGDCCQSGCIPCVYDLYEEARERYLAELQAWEARQRGE